MMLRLENISLSFTGSKDSFKILDGLNLSVKKGKITALIGGNGSGKTTLFNVISGFQDGYTGNIIFEDKPVRRLSPARIAQNGVGRLFQSKPLFQDLSLLDNMKLASGDTSGERPFAYLFRKAEIDRDEKNKTKEAIQILDNLFGCNNKYVGIKDRIANTGIKVWKLNAAINELYSLVTEKQHDMKEIVKGIDRVSKHAKDLPTAPSIEQSLLKMFIIGIELFPPMKKQRDISETIRGKLGLQKIQEQREKDFLQLKLQIEDFTKKWNGMLHDKGADFSYGEQRILSLARLFMGDYRLLLLDEPTAGVNPLYINTIKQIIRRMVSDGKTTVLLIDHNMQFIRDIADKCAYLSSGNIRYQGTPQKVLNNQEVKNSYLGML